MKPIRSCPSWSTCCCLLQGKYVADWKKKISHFKLATKKSMDDHPDYFASKPVEQRTLGVIHRDECYEGFAKRHPRVWVNVVT